MHAVQRKQKQYIQNRIIYCCYVGFQTHAIIFDNAFCRYLVFKNVLYRQVLQLYGSYVYQFQFVTGILETQGTK